MTLNALIETATSESRIYSDHRRWHLYVLRDHPQFAKTFFQKLKLYLHNLKSRTVYLPRQVTNLTTIKPFKGEF